MKPEATFTAHNVQIGVAALATCPADLTAIRQALEAIPEARRGFVAAHAIQLGYLNRAAGRLVIQEIGWPALSGELGNETASNLLKKVESLN